MSRAIKGRTAVIAAFASLAVFLGNATPSAGQTCQVFGNGVLVAPYIGTVQTFGDLKVRLTRGWSNADYTKSYVSIDLKAPGFALNGVELTMDGPLKIYNICGQKVSFAYTNTYSGSLVVGVF